jgi:hypothetical protein
MEALETTSYFGTEYQINNLILLATDWSIPVRFLLFVIFKSTLNGLKRFFRPLGACVEWTTGSVPATNESFPANFGLFLVARESFWSLGGHFGLCGDIIGSCCFPLLRRYFLWLWGVTDRYLRLLRNSIVTCRYRNMFSNRYKIISGWNDVIIYPAKPTCILIYSFYNSTLTYLLICKGS